MQLITSSSSVTSSKYSVESKNTLNNCSIDTDFDSGEQTFLTTHKTIYKKRKNKVIQKRGLEGELSLQNKVYP